MSWYVAHSPVNKISHNPCTIKGWSQLFIGPTVVSQYHCTQDYAKSETTQPTEWKVYYVHNHLQANANVGQWNLKSKCYQSKSLIQLVQGAFNTWWLSKPQPIFEVLCNVWDFKGMHAQLTGVLAWFQNWQCLLALTKQAWLQITFLNFVSLPFDLDLQGRPWQHPGTPHTDCMTLGPMDQLRECKMYFVLVCWKRKKETKKQTRWILRRTVSNALKKTCKACKIIHKFHSHA